MESHDIKLAFWNSWLPDHQIYSKESSLQQVHPECREMGFSWIYSGKPWKIMDEIKWKVWYMVRKIPLFMTYSQTSLTMDYGNAWFALLCQEIFYQLVIDHNSVNISITYGFVHSRYSLICIGVYGGYMSLPNVNLEGQGPHFKPVYWSRWTIKLLPRALDLDNVRFYNQGILGAMSNTRRHLPSDPSDVT